MYPAWEHEYDVRKWIKERIGSGEVFIDVGAHIGVYAIDLAPLFRKVYAVEPWYADELRRNLSDYGIKNVEVIEAAAWDFNGHVIIGMEKHEDETFFGRAEVPRVGLPGKLVRSVRLDDVISEPFTLLKVDVEGEAMHVLRGMERLLNESSGMAVIEVHNHGESHGVFCFMSDHGWRLETTLRERSKEDFYHAYKVFVK